MAQILGITTSDESEEFWSENARRMVFHQYPQGAATLTGLLSLMASEGEDKTKFGWWEDRLDPHKSETSIGTGAGPFTDDSDVAQADPFSIVNTDVLRVYVVDATQFRIRDVIWVRNALTNTGATVDIKGVSVTIQYHPSSSQELVRHHH